MTFEVFTSGQADRQRLQPTDDPVKGNEWDDSSREGVTAAWWVTPSAGWWQTAWIVAVTRLCWQNSLVWVPLVIHCCRFWCSFVFVVGVCFPVSACVTVKSYLLTLVTYPMIVTPIFNYNHNFLGDWLREIAFQIESYLLVPAWYRLGRLNFFMSVIDQSVSIARFTRSSWTLCRGVFVWESMYVPNQLNNTIQI